MPANHCCQAMELQEWGNLMQKGDQNAATTFHLPFSCLHHASCLAKKPGLLGIEGLCSTLVRLARAMKSSKFQSVFDDNVQYLASRMCRREVPSLPSVIGDWLEERQTFRNMVFSGLREEDHKLCMQIFNDIWINGNERSLFRKGGTWTHWCPPGCCASELESRSRGKQALRVLLQIFPDIPLLYRWKGWEPCLFYCIRGCVVHGFLQFALTHSANVDTVNKLESLDEDSPDMSFSLKQEVRLSKAIKVFNSESIYATCICFDLSAVL